MLSRYAGSKWGRYMTHVIGGTLYLPLYCFYGSCVSSFVGSYHLDVGQWVRQNMPTMLLSGLFVFGVSGLVVINKPWPRPNRRLLVGITALAVITPVVTSLLLRV